VQNRLPVDAVGRTSESAHRRNAFCWPSRAAYGVLIAGMILVRCVMPFNSSGWRIINAALAMIVLAEVVHYVTVVISYRRFA